MKHAGGSSSSSGEVESAEKEYAPPPPLDLLPEQDVSPLSADGRVALATSLLAHPHWGPHFRNMIHEMAVVEEGILKSEVMLKVQGEVRAACPHVADNDAYATGVYLLLPHFGADHDLTIMCDDADEEAVAAFYAALSHPTCTVGDLTIEGGAFGTRAAAASLGRLLNVNSTITGLRIEDVDGFCDGPVWTAFSEALTSNATLQELMLAERSSRIGNGRHVGATLADPHKLSALQTVYVWIGKVERQPVLGLLQDTTTNGEDAISALREEMEGWGIMLKHNSTIIKLDLAYRGVELPQGRALLVPLWEGLRTNTTLETLAINGGAVSCDVSTQLDALVEVTSAVDDADSRSLGAMLRTNHSLKKLDIISSGIVCNDFVFDQGLSHNSTLEYLTINVNAPGAQALMAVLAAPAARTTSRFHLCLGNLLGRQGFPTPVALRDMLAFNKTLWQLSLRRAPYSSQEWAITILPALSNNTSLQFLDLIRCSGVGGELVYDALLELLDCNTHLSISLLSTPLSEDGKSQAIHAVTQANSEYRDALKNVPVVATTSCRLVLCGYPFAGKTTLFNTMLCAHSNSTQKSRKRESQSGENTSQELSERTRGIDIQPLMTQGLTLWVWDFAGQKEFHPLQDFIFPNGASIHAATVFVFTFNLVQRVHKMENGANASNTKQSRVQMKDKQQFQQEFSYWLKFICSNAIPRPSRAHKPLVLVVVTHKDRLIHGGTRTGQEAFIIPMLKEWVRDVARKFDDKLAIQADTPFFVDATNKDDPDFAKFVQCALDLLRLRMDDVPKVPAICDVVAKALGGSGSRSRSGGQELQPIISLADFQTLCRSATETSTTDDPQQLEALRQLFSDGDMHEAGVLDKASKVVAAYLRDAGELLYIEDLPFLVRNPRWFAHGILGYLIDIFSPYSSHPDQDFASISLWCYLFELCCSVAANDPPANQSMSQDNNMLTNVNGMVTKDFLTDLLQRAVDIVGLDRQGTSMDQLILLMEKLDLCYQTDDKYLIPALFQDEDGKSEQGEVKREWELVIDANCNFVAIRLQCSDSLRTFITPGFYPRLQVVLNNLADQLEIDGLQCICALEKGFCRLILNDMEILVEYSGYFDYFVDIMVKSYLSQHDTKTFVEKKIISKIRRLCASPKGCQGVTLVEAIIRPDCVGEDITLCRFRQSVQVATLEQQIASGPDLKYLWPAVKDEHGNTVLPATFYRPHDLLDPKWVGWEQEVCYPDSNVHQGKTRGMAVIVSMVTYTRGNRSGGCEDQAKLMTLIEDLHFEVKLLQDSKDGELQKQLKEIAATSISAEDESFLCFVMGHGDSTDDGTHFMLDQDEGIIMLDDIVWPFRTCQRLQGKPKACFVISCRGSNLPLVHPQPEIGVQLPTDWKEGTEVRYVQELTDWLMVFSTSVGSVSARYPGYGTTFVGALVANFSHDKRQATDVLGLLNHVNEEVATEEHKAKGGKVFGQCPVVVHTLTKRLYWRRKVV